MTPRTHILHALSPLHVGIGQAAGLIDLPIARLKGTGIPFVPGSAVKGVLRDAARDAGCDTDTIAAVFGPDSANADKHAGALICTDVRLLALPVRSFRGTFAYVTSPLLLRLAARDLPQAPGIPKVAAGTCMAGTTLANDNTVYLEDLDLPVQAPDTGYTAWTKVVAPVFGATSDSRAVFTERFAVVDDETMTFLWETATQLDQRVRIDEKTRMVAKGALWLEESLPPETLLIGLLAAEPSRHPTKRLAPAEVLDTVLQSGVERVLQFGGKSTVGRGRCRMVAL